MRATIHPKYYKTRIQCACGNIIETCSTKSEAFSIEICSSCHPFFTGKVKLMDIAGRIEKFQKKTKAAATVQAEVKARDEARAVSVAAKKAKRQPSVASPTPSTPSAQN